MLEKLLPFKAKPQQKSALPQINPNLNLLNPTLSDSSSQNILNKTLSNETLYRNIWLTLILLQVITISLIGGHMALNNTLSKLRIQILREEIALTAKTEVGEQLENIRQKTILYKTAEAKRNLLAGKLVSVLGKTPSQIMINQTQIKPVEATLSIIVAKPLDLTLLLTNYLGQEQIKSIIIESATLNTSTKKYDVSLTLEFKSEAKND